MDLIPSLTSSATMSSAVIEKCVPEDCHSFRSRMLGFLGSLFPHGLEFPSNRDSSREEVKLGQAIDVSFVVELLLKLIKDSVPDPSSHGGSKPDRQVRRLFASLEFLRSESTVLSRPLKGMEADRRTNR
jgi:hypothetical protein